MSPQSLPESALNRRGKRVQFLRGEKGGIAQGLTHVLGFEIGMRVGFAQHRSLRGHGKHRAVAGVQDHLVGIGAVAHKY